MNTLVCLGEFWFSTKFLRFPSFLIRIVKKESDAVWWTNFRSASMCLNVHCCKNTSIKRNEWLWRTKYRCTSIHNDVRWNTVKVNRLIAWFFDALWRKSYWCALKYLVSDRGKFRFLIYRYIYDHNMYINISFPLSLVIVFIQSLAVMEFDWLSYEVDRCTLTDYHRKNLNGSVKFSKIQCVSNYEECRYKWGIVGEIKVYI
jgi:hypothetical protein